MWAPGPHLEPKEKVEGISEENTDLKTFRPGRDCLILLLPVQAGKGQPKEVE